MVTKNHDFFHEADLVAQDISVQIKNYKLIGYNPYEIDFSAEEQILNALQENITRLKIRNKHNDKKQSELANAFIAYIHALKTIMDARINLSVDMKDDALDTMAKRIYEPRLTIKEITQSLKVMLGVDYVSPSLSKEQRTMSAISLYSLDEEVE